MQDLHQEHPNQIYYQNVYKPKPQLVFPEESKPNGSNPPKKPANKNEILDRREKPKKQLLKEQLDKEFMMYEREPKKTKPKKLDIGYSKLGVLNYPPASLDLMREFVYVNRNIEKSEKLKKKFGYDDDRVNEQEDVEEDLEENEEDEEQATELERQAAEERRRNQARHRPGEGANEGRRGQKRGTEKGDQSRYSEVDAFLEDVYDAADAGNAASNRRLEEAAGSWIGNVFRQRFQKKTRNWEAWRKKITCLLIDVFSKLFKNW